MGIFNKKKKWGNFNGNINIYDDLKSSDIPKLIQEKDIHSLQFFKFKTPNKKTWEVLNSIYEEHANIGLRMVWYDQMNFDFYSHLPALRNIDIS